MDPNVMRQYIDFCLERCVKTPEKEFTPKDQECFKIRELCNQNDKGSQHFEILQLRRDHAVRLIYICCIVFGLEQNSINFLPMSTSIEAALQNSLDPRTMVIVRDLNNFDKICFKKCVGVPDKKLSENEETCLKSCVNKFNLSKKYMASLGSNKEKAPIRETLTPPSIKELN